MAKSNKYVPPCVATKKSTPNGGEKVQVTFTMTRGEVLSLVNGMRAYALQSPVAADVDMYLRSALNDAGLEDLLG